MNHLPHLLAALTLTLAGCSHAGTPAGASSPVPPGFTMERQGSIADLAYFEGGWQTLQHRLAARGVGSTDWNDFPATLCATPYLDGASTIDELYMPTQRRAGLTVRTFDRERRQWSIYWVNGASGRLDPIPTVGGFQGDRGEFYARDRDGERPVEVRYLWTKLDRNHARWEQAFSYDHATWETNWIADFTRGDAATLCDRGRPRR